LLEHALTKAAIKTTAAAFPKVFFVVMACFLHKVWFCTAYNVAHICPFVEQI